MKPGLGDTQPSLRSLQGKICPACRLVLEVEGEPSGKLLRCPVDGRILVSPEALAEADGDPFLGMTVGGRFAVLERLGAGSMGTVYRARQEAMLRDVALKVVRSDRLVDPQARARFQQEAQAMSMLASRHTATVFDFGVIEAPGDEREGVDGSLYLAMELLDGESLGQRIKRIGSIPPNEAVRIVRHALTSLAEAHDKGVIHRDLKPDNLVLVAGADGEAEICKVLDFGIAKVLTNQEGIDALETQQGTVFGTPRYMSPEQAQGKKLDARSDLYSLGVILYHMLLGRPPFTDGDAVVVMAHHIKTVPKPPSQIEPTLAVPAALEALLMRALSKSADERPQSAGEFIAALDKLELSDPGSSASGELAAVLGRGGGGAPSRRVVVAGGVLVVGLAVVIVVAAVTGGPERPEVSPAAPGVAAVAEGAASNLAERLPSASPPPSSSAAPSASADSSSRPTELRPGKVRPSGKPKGYERFDK